MSIGSWEADDASMSWHGDGVIRFVRLIGVCREGSMFATSRWATVTAHSVIFGHQASAAKN